MRDTITIRGKVLTLTPRMRDGLAALMRGESLVFESTHVGRPTKQRMAKYGLARYLTPKDWDGPMEITDKGRQALEDIAKKARES